MKINKSLDVDLNIISPQKHIRIHEGDVDSVDILIGVTVDDESVDLTGVTIKYDATINNYLAEQDANGSVVDDKISIPVTQNMTAMSGLLLIDVRMIQNDQILFTQTICATVEKAVVNGSTYIDFDKITIIQRMNALEEKMDYIEELVEDFDTSKLIVSTNRPPSGAPAEVDVDLLRIGDTWIEQGENIVYKLVAAQYNYQPAPDIEPYHNYTWQPLNERHGVGNTEPPATETYQAVSYSVSNVSWTWLPVPKYFKGDHYSKHSGSEIEYYSCDSGTMDDVGICTYLWHEEGGGDSIAIPTAEETAEWDDEIPTTYDGDGKKAVYWSGYLWVLNDIIEEGGTSYYIWRKLLDDDNDIYMKLAVSVGEGENVSALKMGQLFIYGGNYYIKSSNAPSPIAQTRLVKSVDLDSKEDVVNKISEITDANKSSETLYPNAKATYDLVVSKAAKVYESSLMPPRIIISGSSSLKLGDIWKYSSNDYRPTFRIFQLVRIDQNTLYWKTIYPGVYNPYGAEQPASESVSPQNYNSVGLYAYPRGYYDIGDIYVRNYNGSSSYVHVCWVVNSSVSNNVCTYSYAWTYNPTTAMVYTKQETDDAINAKVPFIIECGVALSGADSDTTLGLTVSNPTATFAQILSAYSQGRSIYIRATMDMDELGSGTIIAPCVGDMRDNNGNIGELGFNAPINKEIMSLIYPSWGRYDCFIEFGCDYNNQYSAAIICTSAAIADEIGDIETLLSQV